MLLTTFALQLLQTGHASGTPSRPSPQSAVIKQNDNSFTQLRCSQEAAQRASKITRVSRCRAFSLRHRWSARAAPIEPLQRAGVWARHPPQRRYGTYVFTREYANFFKWTDLDLVEGERRSHGELVFARHQDISRGDALDRVGRGSAIVDLDERLKKTTGPWKMREDNTVRG